MVVPFTTDSKSEVPIYWNYMVVASAEDTNYVMIDV